jgi:hypothetical protein
LRQSREVLADHQGELPLMIQAEHPAQKARASLASGPPPCSEWAVSSRLTLFHNESPIAAGLARCRRRGRGRHP